MPSSIIAFGILPHVKVLIIGIPANRIGEPFMLFTGMIRDVVQHDLQTYKTVEPVISEVHLFY